jgi:hypothetical protein
MSRHVGELLDGTPVVDESITLALEDGPNRFWPLVTRMSIEEAQQLQDELATAIAAKASGEGRAGGRR